MPPPGPPPPPPPKPPTGGPPGKAPMSETPLTHCTADKVWEDANPAKAEFWKTLKTSWGIACLANPGISAADWFADMGEGSFLGKARMEKDATLSDTMETSEYIVNMVRFLREDILDLESMLANFDKIRAAMARRPEAAKKVEVYVPDRQLPGLLDPTTPITVDNFDEVMDRLKTEMKTKTVSLESLRSVIQVFKVYCVTYSHVIVDQLKLTRLPAPTAPVKKWIRDDVVKLLKGLDVSIPKRPLGETANGAFARIAVLYPKLEERVLAIKAKYEKRAAPVATKATPKTSAANSMAQSLKDFGSRIVRDAIMMCYALERALRELETHGLLGAEANAVEYHRRIYDFYTRGRSQPNPEAVYQGIVAQKADPLTETFKRADVVQGTNTDDRVQTEFSPHLFLSEFGKVNAPQRKLTTRTLFFLFHDAVKMMETVRSKKEERESYADERNKLIRSGNLNVANKLPFPSRSVRATDIELRRVPFTTLEPKELQRLAMLTKTMFKDSPDALLTSVGRYMFDEIDKLPSGNKRGALFSASRESVMNIVKPTAEEWGNFD